VVRFWAIPTAAVAVAAAAVAAAVVVEEAEVTTRKVAARGKEQDRWGGNGERRTRTDDPEI
jgi:hypothetical protein